MNNLTIVTKLRLIAALAPAILLLAAAVIVGAFHFFGGLPGELHENEYAAARAAKEWKPRFTKWIGDERSPTLRKS